MFRRHNVGEEIWEEGDAPQSETPRSTDTFNGKETEPADNGWETCETEAERENIEKEPSRVARPVITSQREKGRQLSRLICKRAFACNRVAFHTLLQSPYRATLAPSVIQHFF